MRPAAALLSLLLSLPAAAATPDAAARAEIDHLLAYLEQPACEFFRNGRWHPSSEARVHIDKKYQYLLKKGWVRTTEEFIERAATRSSTSGKPYQVRCAGSPPVPSAHGLNEELRRYRTAR